MVLRWVCRLLVKMTLSCSVMPSLSSSTMLSRRALIFLPLSFSSLVYPPTLTLPVISSHLSMGTLMSVLTWNWILLPFSLLEMKTFAQTETSLSYVFPARIKNLIVAINTVAFKPPGSQNCQEGGYTNALLR